MYLKPLKIKDNHCNYFNTIRRKTFSAWAVCLFWFKEGGTSAGSQLLSQIMDEWSMQ